LRRYLTTLAGRLAYTGALTKHDGVNPCNDLVGAQLRN